jgi:hypothetical protein
MAWYRCFFPDINGPEAESLLRENGTEGSFLIRPSSEKPNFTLTAKCSSGIVHTRIQFHGDSYGKIFILSWGLALSGGVILYFFVRRYRTKFLQRKFR